MASFTETATLNVKDNSTGQIRQINAELKQLAATAKSIKNIRIQIQGIQTAISQVNQLTNSLRALRSQLSNLNIRPNVSGLNAVQTQLNQLRQRASQPINIRVNYQQGGQPPRIPPGGQPPGTGGPGGPGRGRGRTVVGTVLQGFNAGMGGGMGFGLMGGLGGVNPAFLAVAAAAWAAAEALNFIGKATLKADRANLQARLGATPEQQDIIQEAVDKYTRTPGRALMMTGPEMKSFIVGMLGDVGGKTATERATAAARVAPQIADLFIPLAYALNPKLTREQSIEGLNTIVKGLNIATGDLTNAQGKFTEDGRRVMEGVALAKAMNPQLDPDRIKNVLANLKTAAFTLGPEALARVLASGGDRGVRVGNELYMAMRGLSGIVDNKALNAALANMGLIEGGKPRLSTRGKPLGGIVAGSGTPIDTDLLRTNPYEWLIKHVLPKVEAAANKSLTPKEKREAEDRARRVQAEGGTPEEVAAAREPMRARMQTFMDQLFPGMTGPARTALADALFGHIQAQSSLAQGKDVLKQAREKGPAIFAESLSSQLTSLYANLETRAGELGTSAAKAIGLDKILDEINKSIIDPTGAGAQNVVGLIQKALGAMEQTNNPLYVGAKLLIAGAELLQTAASGLVKWLQNRGFLPPDTPTGTPEQRAAEIAKAQRGQATTAMGRELENIKTKEQQLALAQEKLRRTPQRNVAERDRLGLVIQGLVNDIATSRENITMLRDFLKHITETQQRQEQQREQQEQRRELGYPTEGDKKPKEGEDFTKGGADLKQIFGLLETAPGAFETAFSTLPERGTTAGSNFSSTAMESISAGASAAGARFGEAAVSRINGAVANVQIAVNHQNTQAPPNVGERTVA